MQITVISYFFRVPNNRIKKYDLVENQDFEVFANFGENPSGGRPLTEYALSIDCAKELSMVEGNQKGKQARRYFIECERQLKENPQLSLSGVERLLELITARILAGIDAKTLRRWRTSIPYSVMQR